MEPKLHRAPEQGSEEERRTFPSGHFGGGAESDGSGIEK